MTASGMDDHERELPRLVRFFLFQPLFLVWDAGIGRTFHHREIGNLTEDGLDRSARLRSRNWVRDLEAEGKRPVEVPLEPVQ